MPCVAALLAMKEVMVEIKKYSWYITYVNNAVRRVFLRLHIVA